MPACFTFPNTDFTLSVKLLKYSAVSEKTLSPGSSSVSKRRTCVLNLSVGSRTRSCKGKVLGCAIWLLVWEEGTPRTLYRVVVGRSLKVWQVASLQLIIFLLKWCVQNFISFVTQRRRLNRWVIIITGGIRVPSLSDCVNNGCEVDNAWYQQRS